MNKNSVFDEDLNYLRKSLIEHPLYNSMNSLSDIKKFMEIHVFAVGFYVIIKKSSNESNMYKYPWIPSQNSLTARLINEIV